MSKDVLVSVIVPVYQGEKYLHQCLESLNNQTIQDIEIIVVNDGSTDQSADIIDHWKNKNPKIRSIDSPNKGVSHARNLGLHAAMGQFVGFADADDWVEKEMFERMVNDAVRYNAELVICNVMIHSASAIPSTRLPLIASKIKVSDNRVGFINQLMDFAFDYANWNKLYRRSIITQHQLQFSTALHIWEDLLFNLEYSLAANLAIAIEDPFYHYRLHEASVMHRQLHGRLQQYNLLYKNFNAHCIRQGDKKVADAFRNKIASGIYNALIPELIREANVQTNSASGFVKMISQSLKVMDPGIFQDLPVGTKGLQRFKKWLLKKNQFTLFAFIVSLKHFSKK